MTIRSQLMTVGVLAALAIPATSNAALAKLQSVHHGNPAASVNKSGHRLKPGTTLTVSTPVPSRPLIIVAPAIVPPALPIAESQQELCQTQGVGCTAQQYCDNWQINCASLGSSDATNGLAADQASSTSDGSSAVDPADQLVALENEYCCDPESCMSVV